MLFKIIFFKTLFPTVYSQANLLLAVNLSLILRCKPSDITYYADLDNLF